MVVSGVFLRGAKATSDPFQEPMAEMVLLSPFTRIKILCKTGKLYTFQHYLVRQVFE